MKGNNFPECDPLFYNKYIELSTYRMPSSTTTYFFSQVEIMANEIVPEDKLRKYRETIQNRNKET